MFVALTPESAPSLSQSTRTKIATAVSRDATWLRGRQALLCTPSRDRVDTAVTDCDPHGLTAVHGDAYLAGEPLRPTSFRALDGEYEEINGEFAGVLETDSGVRVVTDRLNLRQLFVYRSPSAFVAASSVRAVLAYLDAADLLESISLNSTALTEFLDSEHLLGRKTHFEGIELLPGATTLDAEIASGEITYSQDSYWQLEYGQYYDTRTEAVEAVADALRSAIALRTGRDHSVGIHLSGGLDSRLLLAAVDGETELTVYTFGVPYNDEAAIARFLGTIGGHDVVYDELDCALSEYAETGILRTDGQSSIRHFHHLPTMDSLVGDCDRLLLGTSGDVVLGGSKLTDTMFDGTATTATLRANNRSFDRALWNSVFGDVDAFDARTVQESVTDTFEGIEAAHTATQSDIWCLRNRQQRFIFQAGARSVNYYVPVSNPIIADSRVIDAWTRIPPWMRFEGIRPALLRTLDRKMAYVPVAGTWNPPALPWLRHLTGGVRLAAGSDRLRTALPGVEPADPFGYPDYAAWLRRDDRLRALVS